MTVCVKYGRNKLSDVAKSCDRERWRVEESQRGGGGAEKERDDLTWHSLLSFWPQVPHHNSGRGLIWWPAGPCSPPDRWQTGLYWHYHRAKWLQIGPFDQAREREKREWGLPALYTVEFHLGKSKTVHSPVHIFYLLVMTFIFYKQMKNLRRDTGAFSLCLQSAGV